MPQINCYLPIKLRIVGELSDTQLEQLGQTLVRSLRARLAFAEQTIATRHHLDAFGGEVEVHEPYDPAREDDNTYRVPSYQSRGHPVSVALRSPRRGRQTRPWGVRLSLSFRIRVDRFIEWMDSLQNRSSAFVRENQAKYFDLLGTVRSATAWLVMTNQPVLVETLAAAVRERFADFVPAARDFIYGYSVFEAARLRLLSAEEGNQLHALPDMGSNPGGVTRDGHAFLNRNGMLLFVAITLPRVDLAQLAVLGQEIAISLRVRDLDFIVNDDSFERLFRVSWRNYLTEFGDQPTSVRVQTVTPTARVHYNTLRFLVEERIAERVKETAAYFGNLYLLNQPTLNWTPPPVRTRLASITDDATRALDEQRRFGHWEAGWAGAFLYAVLSLTPEDRAITRHRPEARRLTPLLLARLQGDAGDSDWQNGLLHFLDANFGANPPETRPEDGTVFEFVLAELESRGMLATLFDKVEASHNTRLHQQLLRLTLATRYAGHDRVRRSYELLTTRVLSRRPHIYRVAEQEIWLERNPNTRLRVGDVLGDVDSIYIFEREEKRLKPARLPAFREALTIEREALMGRILRGEDTTQYTEESFTRAVLGAAVQRIPLSEKDFEEITLQRSIRLLRIALRTEAALPVYDITFEFIERVRGEPGSTVSRGQVTENDGEFAARLIYWRLARAGEVYEAIGIAISVIGLIAIAWEAGIIALLVQAAGGATPVLISIGISELIYILRVVYGDARWSLRGFLEAALDGYLMALGFRGAGFLGRSVAQMIGTQSLRSLVGGWVAERLIVGVVGGAGTAALTTFSHDLINIATGTGGWSSIGDYVHKMAWGALLGTVFEFGVGALQPILRAGGENALQTLSEVVQRVRAEGFTAVRWTALTAEALGNLRARLTEIIGDVAAQGFARAMGERLAQVVEQLGAEYRLAVFRRVLELSPGAMSRPAVEGLEKFLNTSRAELTNEAALALLNRLNPTQLRTFLEALNSLDDPLLRALSRTGQLDTLAGAPQLASVIRSDPVITDLILEAAGAASGGAWRVRRILEAAQSFRAVPESIERGAVIFSRSLPSGEKKPIIFEVVGRPDLLTKIGGGRSPIEARALIELESMGIDTVYAGTRQIRGQTNIIMERIEGVGSKDIIGRRRQPLNPPQNVTVVTQRTIDDLERIYQTLNRERVNIGDFQFIVRSSDGAVFINDATGFTPGSGPSPYIRSIIDRFRRILRERQTGGTP
jgi:hypothetical protein